MYKHIGLVCTPLTHTDAFTLRWCIDMLTSMSYPHCPNSCISLLLSLSHTHTSMPYCAQQQDCCPPSVNVIHEEMEIWAMNDEFFSMSGLANTSSKTTQPIYAKKKVNIQITFEKNIRGTKLRAKHSNCWVSQLDENSSFFKLISCIEQDRWLKLAVLSDYDKSK